MEYVKGQGHVEMIISFVLFVGFLVFVFLFINPFYESSQEISIDRESEIILQSMSEEIGKLSVVVPDDQNCYDLKDVNKMYGDNFIEVKESTDPGKPLRYTIYYGKVFNPARVGIISCSSQLGREYTLGSYIQEPMIFREKIISLKNAYENDYSKLLLDLGIGHFSFQIRDFNNQIVDSLSVSGAIPDSNDVVSKEIPIQVINNQGGIENYILQIRRWR